MRVYQQPLGAEDLDRAVACWVEHFGARHVATFDPAGLAFVEVGDLRIMFERGAHRRAATSPLKTQRSRSSACSPAASRSTPSSGTSSTTLQGSSVRQRSSRSPWSSTPRATWWASPLVGPIRLS